LDEIDSTIDAAIQPGRGRRFERWPSSAGSPAARWSELWVRKKFHGPPSRQITKEAPLDSTRDPGVSTFNRGSGSSHCRRKPNPSNQVGRA